MPRTRLTQKQPSNSSAIATPATQNGNTIIGVNEAGEIAVSLPGLGEFSIDQVDQFIPVTNRENNQVTDLLNPQITDRITEARKAELLTIYQEGINAEHAKQEGFKYIGEQFRSEQFRNHAVGEFVKVGTSIEKVKQDVINYFTQIERNRKAGADYVTAQMTANSAIATLPETQTTLDEQLRQAQLKRQKAMLNSQKMLNELEQSKQQLGELPELPQFDRPY